MPSAFRVQKTEQWEDYPPYEDELLKRSFMAGCTSIRFVSDGELYKFDFKRMLQRHEETKVTKPMQLPANLCVPSEPVMPKGPAFVVVVPENSADTTISVPLPDGSKKEIVVYVPAEAKAGHTMLVPMPDGNKWMKLPSKFTKHPKLAACGAAATSLGVVGVLVGDQIAAAGAVVVGGGAALASGAAAPLLMGGVAAAGAVGVAAAAVNYAKKNPKTAAATAATAVGVVAIAGHISEVGVQQAAEDVAKGVAEAGSLTLDASKAGVDAAEDLGEAFLDGTEDVADGVTDAVTALF